MTPQDWIAHDPDPVTAAELAGCDRAELAARFARPLTFGTAGLRGPVRGGPDMVSGILTGTTPVAIVGLPNFIPHIRSGAVKAMERQNAAFVG